MKKISNVYVDGKKVSTFSGINGLVCKHCKRKILTYCAKRIEEKDGTIYWLHEGCYNCTIARSIARKKNNKSTLKKENSTNRKAFAIFLFVSFILSIIVYVATILLEKV